MVARNKLNKKLQIFKAVLRFTENTHYFTIHQEIHIFYNSESKGFLHSGQEALEMITDNFTHLDIFRLNLFLATTDINYENNYVVFPWLNGKT